MLNHNIWWQVLPAATFFLGFLVQDKGAIMLTDLLGLCLSICRYLIVIRTICFKTNHSVVSKPHHKGVTLISCMSEGKPRSHRRRKI
jgi:hypothetical protein